MKIIAWRSKKFGPDCTLDLNVIAMPYQNKYRIICSIASDDTIIESDELITDPNRLNDFIIEEMDRLSKDEYMKLKVSSDEFNMFM